MGDKLLKCFQLSYDFLNSHDKSTKQVLDFAILDLQTIRYCRPALDLAYFFCSSTSPNFRKAHLREMQEYYYNELFKQLQTLGKYSKDMYTFDMLLQDYNECFPWGFVMGFAHAQVIVSYVYFI